MRYVALLRGINVAGKNKLPMAQLVKLVEACGAKDVSTYIQSGNVVFTATTKVAADLPAALARRIERAHGFRSPVVMRSAKELERAHAKNPYFDQKADTTPLHVMFLADAPAKKSVATLDPARSKPDRFQVVGREIYLHCPNGIGRSKLTNDYFDKTLGTVSTCRNWRTVETLLELVSG